MSDTWKRWEGQIVNGKFPLVRYLGGSERCAVFLTERREGKLPAKAVIKLISAAPESGELQLSRWQQTAELSHPHLIPLYEMGRFELEGMPIVFVVMECAEENLAQVLPSRALQPAEAREMLESVIDVLSYLHRKGFVHGHIKPANIMASGDQLKLSSDSLRRLGESPDDSDNQAAYDPPEIGRDVIPRSQSISPAGDVWSLGMTLVETLTQNLPEVRLGETQDPLLPQTLQEPFLEIARHCLHRNPEERWTDAQIEARLQGRALMPEPRSPLPAPQRVSQPTRRPTKLRSYTAPIAVGVAWILALILIGPRLLRRHSDAPKVPAAESEKQIVQPAPSQAPSPQAHSTKADKSRIAEQERISKAPVPVPAIIHPETLHEEETNTVAKFPAGAPLQGEVTHKVLPEVLQSARNSIRGTVKVMVKVNVDRSGNVEDAELASRGPSKYFARVALEAAKLWKFKPPMIGGRGVLSSWTLQFEFTRGETTVIPTQEMP